MTIFIRAKKWWILIGSSPSNLREAWGTIRLEEGVQRGSAKRVKKTGRTMTATPYASNTADDTPLPRTNPSFLINRISILLRESYAMLSEVLPRCTCSWGRHVTEFQLMDQSWASLGELCFPGVIIAAVTCLFLLSLLRKQTSHLEVQ